MDGIILLGLLLAWFGPMLVALVGKRCNHSPTRLFYSLVGEVALVAITITTLLIVSHYRSNAFTAIGIHPLRWQTGVYGIGLAIFLMYGFSPLAYWLVAQIRRGDFGDGIAKMEAIPLWLSIVAVFVGGAIEEILYRGYTVYFVGSLVGNYWLVGLISVLVYGLAHIPMWGIGPSLTTILSGGLLTGFFLWSGDLNANIIAHIITDLAGIVIIPLYSRKTTPTR